MTNDKRLEGACAAYEKATGYYDADKDGIRAAITAYLDQPTEHGELIAACELAGHDETQATGQLYLNAADTIKTLGARAISREDLLRVIFDNYQDDKWLPPSVISEIGEAIGMPDLVVVDNDVGPEERAETAEQERQEIFDDLMEKSALLGTAEAKVKRLEERERYLEALILAASDEDDLSGDAINDIDNEANKINARREAPNEISK